MTNEALAELIQQGGNDELLPILWDKVHKLLFIKAERYYYAYADILRRYGYDIQDVRQECYSAMLAAIKWYKPDKGYKFTTYLNYALKHTIRGLYSGKDDALNQAATMSLEQPIGEDKDGGVLTVADTVADDTAAQIFEEIDRYDEFSLLRRAIGELPGIHRDVIKLYYFKGLKLREVGEQLGISFQRVRQIEGEALRRLRYGKMGRRLYEIYSEEYGYHHREYTAASHKGLAAFRSSGTSEIEDHALRSIIRELAAERYAST